MYGADGLKINDSGTSKDRHRSDRPAPPVRFLFVVVDNVAACCCLVCSGT